MEPAPKRQEDLAGGLVDGWPGLRKEHKASWHWLRAASKASSGPVITTRAKLAVAWGCDTSSVWRRLKALAAAGLVEVRRTEAGEDAITVIEPSDEAYLAAKDAADRRRRPRRYRVVGGERDQQKGFFDGEKPDLKTTGGEEPEPQAVADARGTTASGCGCAPKEAAAGNEAGKGNPDHGTKEKSAKVSYHSSKEQLGSLNHGSTQRPDDRAGDEPELIGDLGPQALAQRARDLQEFDAATTPAAQRLQLIRRMKQEVNDPQTDDWLFGYVASLVESNDIHESELKRIYTDMQKMRDAKADGGKGLFNPGGFFRNKLRELPGWREPKKRSEDGEAG